MSLILLAHGTATTTEDGERRRERRRERAFPLNQRFPTIKPSTTHSLGTLSFLTTHKADRFSFSSSRVNIGHHPKLHPSFSSDTSFISFGSSMRSGGSIRGGEGEAHCHEIDNLSEDKELLGAKPTLISGDLGTHGASTTSSCSGFSCFRRNWETKINRSSRWLVFALYAAVVLWLHNEEALYSVIGAVLNSILAVILKRLLNDERPQSTLREDPGMPSSHAQSIHYAAIYGILALVYWQGVNLLTVMGGILVLGCSSYLSWLRVSQGYHTANQVFVGSVIGSTFAASWFWLGQAVIFHLMNMYLPVRIIMLAISIILSLGFVCYVIFNWFKPDRP